VNARRISSGSNEQLQAALAERQGHVWLLESIDRIHRVTRTTNDLEQMMSDVLDAALSIFDCDRAWLMHPCDPEVVSHEVKMQRTRPEFPSLLGVGDEVPTDPETADMFRTVRASSVRCSSDRTRRTRCRANWRSAAVSNPGW